MSNKTHDSESYWDFVKRGHKIMAEKNPQMLEDIKSITTPREIKTKVIGSRKVNKNQGFK